MSVVTLYDIAKSMNPDGTIATPAEIMAESNPILRDAPMLESNLPTGHRETIRNGLPDSYWKRFNKGVIPSKSRREQVTDTIGHAQNRSQIDADEANLNGNSAAWRLSEESAYIESLSQEVSSTIFYGNELENPDEFTGLSYRYSTLNNDVPVSKYVIDAGGTTGKLTSIWLIHWAADTINMRYPKGQPQSEIIKMTDLGTQTITDVDGGRYEVLESKFDFKGGISVKDYRYAVRICNIPVELVDNKGEDYDLWVLLTKAMARIPNSDKGTPRFYMNRDIHTMLDIQSTHGTNIRLKPMELANGEKAEGYRGVPFRVCDALLSTEEAVTA